MKREIRFRAFIEIGETSQIKAMIENVIVYPYGHAPGNIGCFLDDLNKQIEPSGYQFDGNDFIHQTEKEENGLEKHISGDEFNVTENEDWVWINGKVMQFTGLKDKNGKDVYEGDVVNLHPEQDDKGWHRIVEWDTAAFHCRGIHVAANHPLHFHKFSPDKDWVIIGNIYANPELLTK